MECTCSARLLLVYVMVWSILVCCIAMKKVVFFDNARPQSIASNFIGKPAHHTNSVLHPSAWSGFW